MKRRLFAIFVILLIVFGTGAACEEDVKKSITGIVIPTPCITIVAEPAGE